MVELAELFAQVFEVGKALQNSGAGLHEVECMKLMRLARSNKFFILRREANGQLDILQVCCQQWEDGLGDGALFHELKLFGF